jgi:general secretion pathway protein A
MYKTFFGLSENPFNVNPDPRFLYLTPQTRGAMDELTYGIQNRKGFILLTGEVGTGKTTLINYVLNWLRSRKTPTAFIFNSHLSVNHLFDFILTDFGIPIDFRLNSNMLMRLNSWLIERFRAGETPVLIVDEAQGLSFELLEEIRLLLNLETASEKLLQIVLAGQPELEDKLKRPELRQLRQRITLRCNTAPLSREESHGYITERLRIGGAVGEPIFASDAMDAVHFYSHGIPRVINLLCEHALINAYVEHFRLVPARMVDEAAREFFLDEGRQLATHRNSGEGVNSNLAVMHSIFATGLARPFAAEVGSAQEPSQDTSPAEAAAFIAVEEPVLAASSGAATTVQESEAISASLENSNAPGFLKDLTSVLAGPELKQNESALCLDSIACGSGSAASLAAEKKRNQVTILATPPLAVTGSRTEGGLPLAAQSSPTSLAENRTLTLDTVNQLSRNSARRPIPTPLVSWKSRSPHSAARSLPAISPAELSRVSVAALRRISASCFPDQALLRRWMFEFRRDWMAMISALALPEIKKYFFLWLRQPMHKNFLRQAKAGPLEARRDLHP